MAQNIIFNNSLRIRKRRKKDRERENTYQSKLLFGRVVDLFRLLCFATQIHTRTHSHTLLEWFNFYVQLFFKRMWSTYLESKERKKKNRKLRTLRLFQYWENGNKSHKNSSINNHIQLANSVVLV